MITRTLRILIVGCLILLAGCASQDTEALKAQADAARNLAEAYMGTGDYTSALRELLKAEKLNPKDHLLHNDLGLVYLAKQKVDLAIDHFKTALKHNPSYAVARNNLGYAYCAKKDWNAAIQTLKALSGDLLYATPHYPLANLGWAYYNKGDYETAEKYYKDALKIDPNFIIALKGLGKTYLAMENPQAAIKVLKKAAELNPRMAEIYFDLGKAYAQANDTANALDAYRKFLALAPESPQADAAKSAINNMQKSQPQSGITN